MPLVEMRSPSGKGVRSWLSSLAFSRRNTPRGHTSAQMPQPTQEARTMFCPRWAYARTSIPISQNAEQLPHDIHCPPLVVMRKRDLYF